MPWRISHFDLGRYPSKTKQHQYLFPARPVPKAWLRLLACRLFYTTLPGSTAGFVAQPSWEAGNGGMVSVVEHRWILWAGPSLAQVIATRSNLGQEPHPRILNQASYHYGTKALEITEMLGHLCKIKHWKPVGVKIYTHPRMYLHMHVCIWMHVYCQFK